MKQFQSLFNSKFKLKNNWKDKLKPFTLILEVNTKHSKILWIKMVFTHLFTCPYTSVQNGRSKRKHRHITETGLTLLAQAKISLDFLWEAFHTAVYLINRLPTPLLSNKSPLHVLYKKVPDYKAFHPFGCAMFLCLTPYNSNKLQFHSIKCLFFGYSDSHKGYKCLSPQGRISLSLSPCHFLWFWFSI